MIIKRGIYKTCVRSIISAAAISVMPMLVTANNGNEHSDPESISPARGIIHEPDRVEQAKRRQKPALQDEYRTIDGSNNNLDNPEYGAANTILYRFIPADYSDGISELAGADRVSARVISNSVAAQEDSIPNELLATDFLWQWGQFLDHDIDLTDGADPAEPADIIVPSDDLYFSGTIAFNRSIYSTEHSGARQQLNEITAWIDASNVYGSDQERADALRTHAGDGKLKTSNGDLLPFNLDGLPNAGGDSSSLFLAGDVRANEQVGLTAMHTLFVREHNRLADIINEKYQYLSGDEIYEKARQLVGAEMQIITYREYLPALLGRGAIPPYRKYNPEAKGVIVNSFSAAAYRYGHSALSPTLLRLDETGSEISFGHLPLRDAFFRPSRITDEGGIEPLLRGLASQTCQKVDHKIIDDVRNFLFGEPARGGFDLASLNIQRGRDHGLPSYNDMREAFGFGRASEFSDITKDVDTQERLAAVYDSVDDIDLWVGGLAEDAVRRSHLGPLFHNMIISQFVALRDGDRYWYQRAVKAEDLNIVKHLRLADIIRLNTSIGDEIQDNVFLVKRNKQNRKKN